jgi:hypothetical protein
MLSDFNAQFSAKQFPQHKQINLAEPGNARVKLIAGRKGRQISFDES